MKPIFWLNNNLKQLSIISYQLSEIKKCRLLNKLLIANYSLLIDIT